MKIFGKDFFQKQQPVVVPAGSIVHQIEQLFFAIDEQKQRLERLGRFVREDGYETRMDVTRPTTLSGLVDFTHSYVDFVGEIVTTIEDKIGLPYSE